MNFVHKPSTLRAHLGEIKDQSTPKSRTKKALAREFQQLKRQIQQFQDKNEAIIHRIRQSYKVSKKEPDQLYSSQASISKDQMNNIFSINDLGCSCQNLICLPVTNNPVQNSSKSESNQLQTGYEQHVTFSKQEPTSKLTLSGVYDFKKGQEMKNQQQAQFQKYSIKPHKFQAKQPQKRRFSESKPSNGDFDIVEATPTDQSKYQQEEYISQSLAQSSYLTQIQNAQLHHAISNLKQRYQAMEAKNQELSQQILSWQHRQGQRGHYSIQVKTFMKSVKSVFENLFFTISQEYFDDKFLEIQRYVRRLENKIKRLAFQVHAYQQETNQSKAAKHIHNRSLPNRNNISHKIQRNRIIEQPAERDLNRQNVKPNLQKQTIIYYKKLVNNLQNAMKQLKLEFQCQKKKTLSQNSQLILLNQSKIKQSQQLYEKQLRKIQEKHEQQQQLYQQQIGSLKLQLQSSIYHLRKHQQYMKALESQKRKIGQKYLEIKQNQMIQIQQLKIENEKLKNKYQQLIKQNDNAEKISQQSRKKILEREVQLYSLNSKLRTLQNEIAFKDNQITTLQQIVLSHQNSSQSPKHCCNFPTKNSIIKIDFKDSNQQFQVEEEGQSHLLSQSCQIKSNQDVKQKCQVEGQSNRKLNEDESNQLISHNKVLEDKFNKLYEECSALKQCKLEFEQEMQSLKEENHRLKQQMRQSGQKYNKMLKQHQKNNQRIIFLENQLKISKQQLLQTSKPEIINNTQQSTKGIIQSFQYSEMTVTQDKRPQEKQQLQQLENEMQLMFFEEQMQKQDHSQRLIQAQKQIAQKDEQLQLYLQQIEELKAQLELVKAESRPYREGRQNILQSKNLANSMKHNKLANTQQREEYGYRDSISFRLSVDPSDMVNTVLGQPDSIEKATKQDEVLSEKIRQSRSNRKDQIRLFEKTTAYIKQLKGIILEKAIQIISLQNQIKDLEANHQQNYLLSGQKRWTSKLYKSYGRSELQNLDCEVRSAVNDDHYHDLFRSANFGYPKNSHLSISPKEKRQRQLLLEENTILLKEIQILQEELSRSQEQESSLMKIKDFYKEEVKKQEQMYRRKLEDKQKVIKRYQETEVIISQRVDLKDVMKHIQQVCCQIENSQRQYPQFFSQKGSKIKEIRLCQQKVCSLLKIAGVFQAES